IKRPAALEYFSREAILPRLWAGGGKRGQRELVEKRKPLDLARKGLLRRCSPLPYMYKRHPGCGGVDAGRSNYLQNLRISFEKKGRGGSHEG
ncbi:MAG: hypothetical protein P8Y85_07495, partial [Nitrospirota bacterium]